MTLRAIQSNANQKHAGASLTWDAINNMGQQFGAPGIDYDRFAARFDSDPAIQGIVDNFDKSGIVLKTAQAQQQTPAGPQAPEPGKPMMAAAAKRATNLGK
jgi:phage-related minor tail protein